jgi:hypothetical protein
MAEKDVVDNSTLLLVVGAGTILTVATIFAVQGLFHWGADRDFERKNSIVPREIQELRDKQSQTLAGYRVVDANQKRFAIPIDRAMDLVAQEQGRKPN